MFGEFREGTGVGTAAHGSLAALQAAGVEVSTCDLSFGEDGRADSEIDGVGDGTAINLLHVNPHRLARALVEKRIDAARLRRDFTIGYWVWEGSGVPAFWREVLFLLDELWVPSQFVADAVAQGVEVATVVMPHAIEPPPAEHGRDALGLPLDSYLFLTAFDGRSYYERKNPGGAIQAYRAAFPEVSNAASLIIKTKNLRDPQRDLLQSMGAGRSDILIIDDLFDGATMASLIAQCDCFVSLHRAEGFGLMLAEAMYFGKPVIATGWSGNLDFMSEATAFLAKYKIATLPRNVGVFPAGTRWADTDVEDAARLMRQVFEHRAEAREVGTRAADIVREKLSAATVGARMARRLRTIVAARSGGSLAPGGPAEIG